MRRRCCEHSRIFFCKMMAQGVKDEIRTAAATAQWLYHCAARPHILPRLFNAGLAATRWVRPSPRASFRLALNSSRSSACRSGSRSGRAATRILQSSARRLSPVRWRMSRDLSWNSVPQPGHKVMRPILAWSGSRKPCLHLLCWNKAFSD